QEVFSSAEMIEHFDIADVNQSASAFNPEKLRWLNQQYIKAADADLLAVTLRTFLEREGYDVDAGPAPRDVIEAYRERAETLSDMAGSARYCYEDFDEIDAKAAKKHLRPVVLEPLRALAGRLAGLDEWQPAAIEAAIGETAAAHEINMGKLGQPLRVAVTGAGVSPPIDATVFLVGRERVLERLAAAIRLIEARVAAST
ncbi:MAG: glutamate--tRNA ligase, partial [Woeseiaceae bacterium]|nr:glutamate--tRNA ligase [Woeseiaceae bacterium]